MNYRKIISFYQILGGISGLYVITQLLYGVGLSYTSYFIIFIILYFIMILAGVFLFQENAKGQNLTIIVQSLQILQFSLGGLQYKFGAGTAILIGFKNIMYKLSVNFMPVYAEFNWAINDKGFFLYINIVPIFIIYLLKKTAINK